MGGGKYVIKADALTELIALFVNSVPTSGQNNGIIDFFEPVTEKNDNQEDVIISVKGIDALKEILKSGIDVEV